jgi:16S rRNA A1518/A1519 N6-dimethyltransferase RsmA/KsgA/DIM1 with predicted DNA glycosylase/AP lyase activity
MIDSAGILPTESVVEIGTGKGTLTRELAGLCSRLDGYEVDRENYRQTLLKARGSNVFIHLADAFEERRDFDVLVSSLPYSRSQDFIEWISQVKYDRAVVLLQEDFVRKVLSPPGSRDYRAVSAIAQISSEMEEICRVGSSAFQPPPKVSSRLVIMKPKIRLTEEQISIIKKLFSLRRRTVSFVLARFALPGGAEECGGRRFYSLTPEEVYEICQRKGSERDLSPHGPAEA